MPIVDVYFWLIVAHFVCDFPLQGDWLARTKNPNDTSVPGEIIWPISLLGHAVIHAGGVYLITRSHTLAVAEFASHAVIDYHKCKGRISYVWDQALHLQMKLFYVAALYFYGAIL